MYLNTFLIMFGLDPDNFINELVEPFTSDAGETIYNLRQRTDIRICPNCNDDNVLINDYYYTNTRFTTNDGLTVIIRIKRARFKCKECNKTFTNRIRGIDRYSRISNQARSLMIKDFYKQKSFSLIAKDYGVSTQEVMAVFDKEFPTVYRSKLPKAMCIDEIGFKTIDGSYAAIIYDHDKKIVVDVIRNRQSGYLSSYFMSCSFYERREVKYFISDLYEGYTSIKQQFFNEAIHIADMFHVIRLLRVEVSRLRKRTIREKTIEGDIKRSFMKRNWEMFERFVSAEEMRKPRYIRSDGITYTTWDLMRRCLELDIEFWDAYNTLQDLMCYWKYKNYTDAVNFIEMIYKKLIHSGNDDLIRVGNTYHKWRYEIANAIHYKNDVDKRYSNGPAEGMNNAIKTIIKDGNGYRNFERFRKRVLLILNKAKDPTP